MGRDGGKRRAFIERLAEEAARLRKQPSLSRLEENEMICCARSDGQSWRLTLTSVSPYCPSDHGGEPASVANLFLTVFISISRWRENRMNTGGRPGGACWRNLSRADRALVTSTLAMAVPDVIDSSDRQMAPTKPGQVCVFSERPRVQAQQRAMAAGITLRANHPKQQHDHRSQDAGDDGHSQVGMPRALNPILQPIQQIHPHRSTQRKRDLSNQSR
jgi:hypothetical protein